MATRAVAYCRISDDRRREGLGVERQLADCRTLATAKGWEIVCVNTDNDLSAYSGKTRPQYEVMLDALRRGEYDAVLAWHPDRLHRSPAELEEFIAVIEANGVHVETVQAGAWDLSTASGRLIARQLGSIARYESDIKSERVRRALQQNAEKGATHGRFTYGWTREFDPQTGRRSRDIVEPAEAAIVREIAERLRDGDSLRAITADLTARDVPSPTGKPWRKGMVRALVLRERNVGLRVYRGKVIGDGDWKPILERGLWEQVRAILADPQRKTSTGTAAKHLLSGIAVCGKCGAPVRATLVRGVPTYKCRGWPGQKESGCVARSRVPVDRLVTDTVVGWLAQPEAAAVFAADRAPDLVAAEQKAREIRALLDNVTDAFTEGAIDRRQLERATARLRPMLEVAEAACRVIDDRPLLTGLLGVEDVRAVWDSLPLSRQRAIVDLLLEVRILSARQGGRTFNPQSVEIVWKT